MISRHQDINDSTTSTHQDINASTHQHTMHQDINTSRHQGINASTHHGIVAPGHQDIRKIGPRLNKKSALRAPGGELRKTLIFKRGGARAAGPAAHLAIMTPRRGAPPWGVFDAPCERASLGEPHEARRTRLVSFRPGGEAQFGRRRRARRGGDAQV